MAEEPLAVRRDGVPALRRAGGGVVPLRRDEPFLFEPAKQAIEVAHLDARLARELREPLEEVVAMGRALAQKKEQCRLREALDPGEDPPAAVVMAAGARPSHPAATCKRHM